MAAEVLASPRQPAAQDTGPSSGLATAGFRSAKYLLEEWRQAGHTSFYQTYNDRDSSERSRHEAKQLAGECEARAQRSQADTTKRLGERLLDIHYWRSELDAHIRELSAETELLLHDKNRLQRALDATRIPLTIATDNLQSRERRVGGELVRDGAELELIKEVELIRNVQELLKRTLEQSNQQIRMNRDAKEKLEMDWSDKVEAYDTDDQCGRYTNQSTDTQLHHNSSRYQDNTSTPDSWAQYSQDNIYHAEKERLASINLRSLIGSILQDTSEDMRSQCDSVTSALTQRCEEVEDVKRKLEDHLSKTLEEIGSQERNMAALRQAIQDKEAPMRVAQTRLHQRSYRPRVELCGDPAQYRLVSEVGELTESVETLKQKLEEGEQCLRNLEESRMALERDIANKANTLFIDREKCLSHRTRYPTVLHLSGYQ